ncbi:hypothetical protein LOZ36_006139 [Ophidiomyces ophidiicola]|nr:hypothetical protein LOZ36_006139 [Ophidiomyces ophidiicola]
MGLADDQPAPDSGRTLPASAAPTVLPPYTFFRGLLYGSRDKYEAQVTKQACYRAEASARLVNRPLTEGEVNFLAENAVDSIVFRQTFAFTSLAMATGFWIPREVKEYRAKKLEPDYALASRFSRRKMIGFRVVRSLFVLQFCYALGYWCGHTAGTIYISTRTMSDERMEQFRKDIPSREEVLKRAAQLRLETGAQYRRARNQQQAGFSPTQSSGEQTEPAVDEFAPDDAGFGDSKVLGQVYSQGNNAFQSHPAPQDSQPQTPRQPPKPSGELFWDDDSSPTNANADTASPSGSVWERIRQNSSSLGSSPARGVSVKPPPQKQQDQPESNDGWQSVDPGSMQDSGDRYSGDSRTQAQRDFDRMVEREREFGSDIERDGGNAWSRKW